MTASTRRRPIIVRAINAWWKSLNYNPKNRWTEDGGEKYFKKYPPTGTRKEDIILKILENEKFDSLIDIGCGYGRYLKVISEQFPNVKLAGVDISPTQLEKAKSYLKDCKNIELKEIDGAHIPYGNKLFDISLTYGCMIHAPHSAINRFIKEIQRISRRGVFIESNRIRTTIKNRLFPDFYWYLHNYNKLFKKFEYEVKCFEKYEKNIIERLFYVNLDPKK